MNLFLLNLSLAVICQRLVSFLPEEIAGGSLGINIGVLTDRVNGYYAMAAVLVDSAYASGKRHSYQRRSPLLPSAAMARSGQFSRVATAAAVRRPARSRPRAAR